MELSLIGLQNAGKTSLVNVVAVSSMLPQKSFPLFFSKWLVDGFLLHFLVQTGGYSEDMIPTVCYTTFRWRSICLLLD